MNKKTFTRDLLLLIPALAVFYYLVQMLSFTQDDAYISYRYVQNFLNGDGLVYNIGVQVEGYTNFGWVIYLTFCGIMKSDYILVSKITGALFGAGVIGLSFILAKRIFGEKGYLFSVAVLFLVATNQSLAYWSQAGLETSAFAFFALFSFYAYIRRSKWMILGLLFAILLRPDGVVIAGAILLIEIIETRKLPIFTIRSLLVVLIFMLPNIIFKLFYYGSIFPNTFFAKTGFSLAQLQNGMEYAFRFLSHYGFYGIGFVVPLILYKRLNSIMKSVLIFSALFLLYIVFVGGDVLKVHRFFLPLIGFNAILLLMSVYLVIESMSSKIKTIVVVVASIAMLYLSYELPREFVDQYYKAEKVLSGRMGFLADSIKKSDPTDFSCAISTIGIFGYNLIGHDVIDLLGLTDSTIARHPADKIEGMKTTWKEQRHNSKYVLGRQPDYIVFSTGEKPSAPAEKALWMFPSFVNNYRYIGWFYETKDRRVRPTVGPVLKRVKPIENVGEPTLPIEYVESFVDGIHKISGGDAQGSIDSYDNAIRLLGDFVNPYVLYQKAYSLVQLQKYQEADKLFNEIVKIDSLVYEAHRLLYITEGTIGDSTKAEIHRRWLYQLVPWQMPQIENQLINIKRGMKK